MFKNSIIWALAFSWCFIYIIRTGINDWGNLYLTETHGYDLLKANSAVSFFEIGGFLGHFLRAGALISSSTETVPK